ncbi:UNVERIFIED_CONTAM: hypothetical protein Slati_0208800 [Sesamum latifolium]|uniref:Uncharacterized protein n=1 Tax=Sesamum latifolium TaxID=2727402 RepID=A0AAW2YBL6_9LAMI
MVRHKCWRTMMISPHQFAQRRLLHPTWQCNGVIMKMNWDQRMVYDTAGPQFFSMHPELEAEGASSSFPSGGSSYDYDVSDISERFFYLVHASDQPLYSECDEPQLATVVRLVNIKVEHNMSGRCYDQVSSGLVIYYPAITLFFLITTTPRR